MRHTPRLRALLCLATVCVMVACSRAEPAPPETPGVAAAVQDPFAQRPQSPTAAAIREIERYRAESRARVGIYRQVERSVEGLSSEGAQLTAWFDQDVLRLADVTIYGEGGSADLSFLFSDAGVVRLVERTDHGYDAPHGAPQDERTWRFYFDGDTLLAATVSDRIVDPVADPSAPRASDLLVLSRRIAESARRR